MVGQQKLNLRIFNKLKAHGEAKKKSLLETMFLDFL
jgi:hypothetical protein